MLAKLSWLSEKSLHNYVGALSWWDISEINTLVHEHSRILLDLCFFFFLVSHEVGSMTVSDNVLKTEIFCLPCKGKKTVKNLPLFFTGINLVSFFFFAVITFFSLLRNCILLRRMMKI